MLAQHFAMHRIAWSRAALVGILFLILLGGPPRLVTGWLALLFELLGYALLVAASLWRIWCHLFIAGAKNRALVTDGPYSVVRNPLYLGTFLGLLGFGLAVEQPYLALGLAAGFVLFYPAVVRAEEARLTLLFGQAFREYCAAVRRWIPDWSLYREPDLVTIRPHEVRKAILDAMWFLWAFAIWEFIEHLHATAILPRIF